MLRQHKLNVFRNNSTRNSITEKLKGFLRPEGRYNTQAISQKKQHLLKQITAQREISIVLKFFTISYIVIVLVIHIVFTLYSGAI